MEQLRARRLASTFAAYKLRNVGFNNKEMSAKLKLKLRDTYCRSKLMYGMENTCLTERNYKDLEKLESGGLGVVD